MTDKQQIRIKDICKDIKLILQNKLQICISSVLRTDTVWCVVTIIQQHLAKQHYTPYSRQHPTSTIYLQLFIQIILTLVFVNFLREILSNFSSYSFVKTDEAWLFIQHSDTTARGLQINTNTSPACSHFNLGT